MSYEVKWHDCGCMVYRQEQDEYPLRAHLSYTCGGVPYDSLHCYIDVAMRRLPIWVMVI